MSAHDIPRVEPVFFYSDDCAWCQPTLIKILPIFSKLKIRLTIRKPTVAELRTPGFKFPALLMPDEVFNLSNTVLMVGSSIPEQLESVLDQCKKIDSATINT